MLLGARVHGQSSKLDSILAPVKSDSLKAYAVRFGDFDRPGEQARLVNSLDELHRYHPLLNGSPVRNDLGNLGSAEHLMLFAFDRPFGFRFTDSRAPYFRRASERRLLVSDKAFSNVRYVNGQNQENLLRADFARSFGTSLQAGFHFGRINSKGYYANQQSKVTDLSVYALFKTRDMRYQAQFIFDWQDIDTKENGGLLNDTVFEANRTSGRAFIPVNRPQASNRRVGFDIGLEHRFALPRMWTSDSTYYSKRFVPVVEHSFAVERYANTYLDVPGSSGFYQSIYRDSLVTKDSTSLLGVTNTVRLRLLANDSSAWASTGVLRNAFVGVGHRYDQVNYDSISHNAIHNLFIELGVDGHVRGQVHWWANDRFMLAGHNAFDNRVEGGLGVSVGRTSVAADVVYHAFRPDYITEHYLSNHFIVSNDFGKTNHLSMGVRFTQGRSRTTLEVRYHLFQNLVVFGFDRLPFQSADVNQLVVARWRQKLTLRWFHFDLDAAVQFRLSGDDIRLPMALGRGMVYYQNDLFKKKLRLQLGFDVSYCSAYMANAYNPALSVFHLQNQRSVGNYPFMDFFLNLRIKTFQAFFKMEHWNAGLMGYRYYHVPHHPANDMGWKFGIRWAFLD